MRSTLSYPLWGMGFVPGVARGKLTRNPATNGLLLADHKILQRMSGSPSGCVLLDGAPFSHAAIGLVRTEFLLPGEGVMPDRAFYLEAFEAVLEAARPLPVTLRLLDLAPDKLPTWASALPDTGPLGLHGSRLFRHPLVRAAVEAQLEALGLLSRRFTVGVLVPNVDNVEQFQHQRNSINAALSNPGVSVGAMLETPGAALAVDGFLATADLVGFGLNDLMQSLFGADRDLPAVRAQLDPYAPALYRFLRLAAELAGPGVSRVQLCGILPQLPGVLPVLLGLGYRTFSVDVAHAPYLARTVATSFVEEDRGLAEAVCAADSGQAIADLLGVWHEGKRARQDAGA